MLRRLSALFSRRLCCTLLVAPLLVLTTSVAARGQVGGIYIDAEGVVRESRTLSPGDWQKLVRSAAGRAGSTDSLPADVSRSSPLRMVSLKRLEATVREAVAQGQPVPAEAACLAGLTAIQYVILLPDQQDAILAGPAEGWHTRATGELVGVKSGRPVLQLDDLVTVLRHAFDRQAADFIGCSIEPTAEGMNRYAGYMRSLGGRIDRSRLQQVFGGMAQAMGPQDIKVYGIPADSPAAVKLVAADYRLKRVAMGHDASPVPQLENFLDLQAKRLRGAPRTQPQHRWWFLATCEEIAQSPDGLCFELRGAGVEVATARLSSEDGKQSVATPAARQFATMFTKHFDRIAAEVPVFAEVRSLVQLAIAAELLAQAYNAPREPADAAKPPMPEQLSWQSQFLLDEKQYTLPTLSAPQSVPSLAAWRLVRNRHWLIAVSGGVEMQPARLAAPEAETRKVVPQLQRKRNEIKRPEDASRWWWDCGAD